MTTNQRLDLLVKLGDHLLAEDDYLYAVMRRTEYNNPWFTLENQEQAVKAIAQQFLRRDKLEEWLSAYDIPPEPVVVKTVGLIMAGNIPLAGFHDLLCVFVAGHRAMIKLSEKDQYLLPYLIRLLIQFDERAADYFEVVERLNGFDAVIATGSNNSARYFEAYFGKYPHIIRRNRNGVAVLTGEESHEALILLGKDIFRYFGMGCRSVAKVYVPEGYHFEPLLEALHEYRDIVLSNKYKNNFDYNFALHILNKAVFMNNGCIMLTENPSLQSRIAQLHYEYYQDLARLEEELAQRGEEIQCVIAEEGVLPATRTFPFGSAQEPGLGDYADGEDTIRFLLEL